MICRTDCSTYHTPHNTRAAAAATAATAVRTTAPPRSPAVFYFLRECYYPGVRCERIPSMENQRYHIAQDTMIHIRSIPAA